MRDLLLSYLFVFLVLMPFLAQAQSLIWQIPMEESVQLDSQNAMIDVELEFSSPFASKEYSKEIERQFKQTREFAIQACHYNIPQAEKCEIIEESGPISSPNTNSKDTILIVASRHKIKVRVRAMAIHKSPKLIVSTALQTGYTYFNSIKSCADLPQAEALNQQLCDSKCDQKRCELVYAGHYDLRNFLQFNLEIAFPWFSQESIQAVDTNRRKECIQLVKHQCLN